jgi:RHS repeat-associated protein
VLRDRDTDSDGDLDERRYALQDANWNVVAIADDGGDVDERFAYNAYGQSTVLTVNYAPATDDKDWETRYTGQRFDTDTALYLYRMRYYHDGLGRFVSRDSLDTETQFAISLLNSFEYGRSAPIVFVDSSGNVPAAVAGAAAAVKGTALDLAKDEAGKHIVGALNDKVSDRLTVQGVSVKVAGVHCDNCKKELGQCKIKKGVTRISLRRHLRI